MEALVTEIVNGKPYSYYPLGRYVVRAPRVRGGRPTFKYTRIEIRGTLDRIASGESIDKVVKRHRGKVPREAILEAIGIVNQPYLEAIWGPDDDD